VPARLIVVACAALFALLPAGAGAQPAVAPADQARAFLTDYFAPDQKPPRRAQRRFEDWMTSRFSTLYRQAVAMSRTRGMDDPFIEADPVLNAQDSDQPGDIRIESVGGTPDRPAVRVSFRVIAGEDTRTTQILVFAEDRGEWRLFDIQMPHDRGGGMSSLRQHTESYVARGRGRR
jgi:hypothetical protein